jgi:hypothetical protein
VSERLNGDNYLRAFVSDASRRPHAAFPSAEYDSISYDYGLGFATPPIVGGLGRSAPMQDASGGNQRGGGAEALRLRYRYGRHERAQELTNLEN